VWPTVANESARRLAGPHRRRLSIPRPPPTDVFVQRHTRTLSFERRPPTTGGLSRQGGGSTSSVFTNPLYATLVVVVVIFIVIAGVIITICHSAERVSAFNKVFTLSNFVS